MALALEATDEKVGSEKTNAMFDTLNVTSRPQILESLETRDATTLAFLAHGGLVSALNIAGLYENYETVAIGVAAFLGLINVAVGTYELASGGVADDERPGFAHERSIILYTTAYLAAVVWLSCRFSPLYPAGLAGLDAPLCVASACVYVYGLLSPLATLTLLHEQLTPTEVLRMKGMVASGAVGAVFLLETFALLLNDAGWWERVLALYPAQSVLEPSVTLFAAYAVEAGMLVHRLARRGVITFAQAVPLYAKGVLPLLTLLPMGCLFWWKRDEVSFWDFFWC